MVGLHIDAFYAILANRVTGRGGVVENAIVEALHEARRKFGAEAQPEGRTNQHERDA